VKEGGLRKKKEGWRDRRDCPLRGTSKKESEARLPRGKNSQKREESAKEKGKEGLNHWPYSITKWEARCEELSDFHFR